MYNSRPASIAEDTAAPTFPHEIRLPQNLRHSIIEWQLRRVGHGKRKVANGRVVQVVRQRNAVPGRDLQHFVFAVAVERCPLNRFGIWAAQAKSTVWPKCLTRSVPPVKKNQKGQKTNHIPFQTEKILFKFPKKKILTNLHAHKATPQPATQTGSPPSVYPHASKTSPQAPNKPQPSHQHQPPPQKTNKTLTFSLYNSALTPLTSPSLPPPPPPPPPTTPGIKTLPTTSTIPQSCGWNPVLNAS